MMPQQPAIKAKLEQEILLLQGFKPLTADPVRAIDIGPIAQSFPFQQFPTGGIHEFLISDPSDDACTTAFIAGILAHLMRAGGAVIWITGSKKLFPPAFKQFGIEPDRLILIDLRKEKEALWVMEEALQYPGLAAVVGELNNIDFTASRRLQLAVEKSRVTGFILRTVQRRINTIAAVARWQVTSLPSESADGLPGVSFPRWKVDLLRVRNGRTGSWTVQWQSGGFRFPQAPALGQLPAVPLPATKLPASNKKTG
ncbi:ImuA family protein [Paraflavitalea pollutisoli]|uniref:ImuA family protein n=1 Tax=Paraflavitalea pollutisoli TaxID=3034143 RepID=UPI0023EDEDCB|nr:Error-prone repair protein ImuA [Paraflavitalea sp. H1-2-19X]